MTNPLLTRRGLPQEAVLLGNPQPAAQIIDAARTVKSHWNGILRWFNSRIANGLIEGIDSLVQAAKAKAAVTAIVSPNVV